MTATITLDDDDQPTVRRMLTYFYTLDYDDADTFQSVDEPASQDAGGHILDSSSKPDVVDDAKTSHRKRMNNLRVYALAEKYDIPVLKELAKTKFKLCNIAFDLPRYREVVKAICESTPTTDLGLRNIVILECVNASMIEKCLEEECLAPVIRDHGHFGLEVLREVVKKHKQELEMEKKVVETKTEKWVQALGSLHDDAMDLYIPDEEDSALHLLETFQSKLRFIRDCAMLDQKLNLGATKLSGA